MWKLIKAELSYFRYSIFTAFVIAFLFLLIMLITGDIANLTFSYLLLGVMVYMFLLARWGHYMVYKENLERMYAQLPLSMRTIGLARIASGWILWLGFLCMFAIPFILFPKSLNSNFSIWSIVVINGIVLMLNVSQLIWHDFLFYSRLNRRKFIAYLFYIPLILGLFGIIYILTATTFPGLLQMQHKMQNYFFNPSGALYVNAFGIILTGLSYYLYINRNSYLSSEFGLRSNIKVMSEDIS